MQKPQSLKLPWLIGLISVLPLWLCAYATYRPLVDFSPVTALALAPIYGGIYLSFIGGAKWGLVSAGTNLPRPALQMLLSFVFLLAGFAAVILPAVIGLSILLIGFILMALWDLIHSQAGVIVFWYAKLRIWITIFIVAPLLTLLLKVL